MTNKRLKILFTTSWYMTRITPLMGDFIFRHALAVSKYDQVTLLFVTYDKKLKKSSELVTKNNDGVNEHIIFFNIPILLRFLKPLYYCWYWIRGFMTLNKYIGPFDIIHHNVIFPFGILIGLISKFSHIPMVLTEHWTGYLTERKLSINWLHKFICSQTAKRTKIILPVSEPLKRSLKIYVPHAKFKVIPNGVDENLFLPEVKKTKHEKIKILHISSLNDAHKNISGIIRAFNNSFKVRNDLELIIINSESNSEISRLITQLKLDHCITMMGNQKHEKVAEIIRMVNFVVMFSWYETQGCVILEALMSGIPVITTKTGGIENYVNSTNGIFVEKGDESALCEAILQLSEKHGEYDPQMIRKNIEYQVSMSSVGKMIHEVYVEILNS